MYLTYVDESGKPESSNPERDYVLVALLINERDWNRINDMVTNLKIKYFPEIDPASVEFHAVEIFHHQRCYRNLPLEVRLNIFRDVLEIVSIIDCVINIVIVEKDRLDNDIDVSMKAVELLFDGICSTIKTQNESIHNKGDLEYCILIIDSVNAKSDNKIRQKLYEMNFSDDSNNRQRLIIENPFFTDSKYRQLSQVVDCVAYVVRRKFRTDKPSIEDKELFDEYFDLIKDKIQTVDGKSIDHGLVLFP